VLCMQNRSVSTDTVSGWQTIARNLKRSAATQGKASPARVTTGTTGMLECLRLNDVLSRIIESKGCLTPSALQQGMVLSVDCKIRSIR